MARKISDMYRWVKKRTCRIADSFIAMTETEILHIDEYLFCSPHIATLFAGQRVYT